MILSCSFTQHGSLWRLSALHKVPETDSPTLIYCLLIYNFAKSTELEQVIEKRGGYTTSPRLPENPKDKVEKKISERYEKGYMRCDIINAFYRWRECNGKSCCL